VNWEPISSPTQEIGKLKSTQIESEIQLSWFWSNEIDFVYIYQTAADHVKPITELNEQDLKLYTREEYKVHQGFVFTLETIGPITVRIFPGKIVDGKQIVYKQENSQNLFLINGQRASVYVSITYKTKLFHARKKVNMSIMTDLPIDKELLIYVKKSGGVPRSPSDGTVYPFIRDFPAGKTVLPEIEIEKHEFIQLFLSTGKQAAQHYELIPIRGSSNVCTIKTTL
jgi:hypothetical protein